MQILEMEETTKTGRKKQSKNKPSDAITAYVAENRKVYAMPKDQYSHSFLVLDSEKEDYQHSDEHLNPTKIVDKHVQLCSVGDDTLMRLYQNDVLVFTILQDLARRDPAMEMIYKVLHQAWRNEMLLTKTKDGAERKLQATASSPKYVPIDKLGGYGGEGFGEEEEKENILSKLLGGKRRE